MQENSSLPEKSGMQEQSTARDRLSAQEKSSYTTAHAILCAEHESIGGSWTADVGLCRWITFRQDGTGVLFGSRQLSVDVLLDFTWKELDAGLGRPFQLTSPIPRKPEVLAEFKLELNLNATSAQRVQLGRDTIADRRPGPFKGLDPGPRLLAVRLERGFFTPDENTAGCPPWYFELRLVFDRSPYGTQQDWRMYDLGGGDWGYWDHKTFIARHCESPPSVLQYARDSCVIS